MSSKAQVEDDDLAMYTLGLLEPDEAVAVSRAVHVSDELKQRLGNVQDTLALYGEASVELTSVPEGSLDRLKDLLKSSVSSSIDAEEEAVGCKSCSTRAGALPEAFTGTPALRKTVSNTAAALAWLGWAVAAVLLVATGKLYQDHSALSAAVAAQVAQTGQISNDLRKLDRERNSLRAVVAEQAVQIGQLSQRTASAKNDSETLRSAIVSQNSQIASQNAQIASQNNQILLKNGRIDSQNNQVARLSSDAATAHEILVALTSDSALRLPLTKPKSHAVPLAQAAYVANQRTLVFLASNLAPLKPNKTYQLWLMPANGASPVPAGIFAPDARGQASLFYTDFSSAISAIGFSVTIENSGGSQTPTLPIILASGAA